MKELVFTVNYNPMAVPKGTTLKPNPYAIPDSVILTREELQQRDEQLIRAVAGKAWDAGRDYKNIPKKTFIENIITNYKSKEG